MEWGRITTQTFFALIAGVWHSLPELTQVLVILMTVDILFGLTVAIKQRQLSLEAALWGITRKVGVLILVAVAALLTPYAHFSVAGLQTNLDLGQVASAYYIVPEIISLSQHAASLGIPVFAQMTQVMRHFQNVGGNNPDDKP